MTVIALLPMKAHSERVPNKNMRDFCGRPLYHAVLESLLASKQVSRVVVNTDSITIKKDVLHSFREEVLVHDRPEGIRGDFVSMNEIISHDLGNLEGEHFLQTHSTNPLLKAATIDRALEHYFEMLEKGYDSLFSVTRLHTRLYYQNGSPINHDPEKLLRTQDLPPVYEENSCLYIFNRKGFALHRRRIGQQPIMFEISKDEAIDIDEESDFRIAECLYKISSDVGGSS